MSIAKPAEGLDAAHNPTWGEEDTGGLLGRDGNTALDQRSVDARIAGSR